MSLRRHRDSFDQLVEGLGAEEIAAIHAGVKLGGVVAENRATGEATEWVLHQAAEDGGHYLAAGHYATERFGIQALGRWLTEHHSLEVEYIDLPNPV